MTNDRLEQRLNVLRQHLEQAKANLQALAGAIQFGEQLLSHEPPTAPTQPAPVPRETVEEPYWSAELGLKVD
jgi:outer membrane protein TolC